VETRDRFSRLLKKSGKQIPRGLKPARDDKNKSLSGTAEAVPFQIASARGVFQQPAGTGNEAERWLSGKKRDALPDGLSIVRYVTNVVM
jgi:hypothetical protein